MIAVLDILYDMFDNDDIVWSYFPDEDWLIVADDIVCPKCQDYRVCAECQDYRD